MTEQWELCFDKTDEEIHHLPGWQTFQAWLDTYGGRKIMQYLYKATYPYAIRYQKFGRQTSFSLIWETVRDRIEQVRRDARRRGIDLRKYNGYTLNNDIRSYAMRHIIKRRPEWDGMFRLRAQGTNKVKQGEAA